MFLFVVDAVPVCVAAAGLVLAFSRLAARPASAPRLDVLLVAWCAISLFTKQVHFMLLAGLGWRVDVRAVSGRFPRPGALERQRVGAALADLPDDATVLVDGLVFGAVPEIAEREEIGRAHV